MIRKRCDNCDRTIEVGDDLAGRKVACEACGDINVMPAAVAGGKSSGSDRASRLGLPADSGPEQRVRLVRPAMIRARPLFFVAHLLVGGLGTYGLIWGFTGESGGMKTAGLVAGAVAMLVVLGSLGVWKLKTLAEAIEITNKRTVLRRGLLSKASSEVVHDNIRNVQVTQSFWERLWGVGAIGLSSSGQDGIEIEIRGIPRPERVREMIDVYRPLG